MQNFNISKFSACVKETREIKKVSLRELASELKVSYNTIHRIEKGNIPDMDKFIVLCHWMQISPKEFFGVDIEYKVKDNIISKIVKCKELKKENKSALITFIKLAFKDK